MPVMRDDEKKVKLLIKEPVVTDPVTDSYRDFTVIKLPADHYGKESKKTQEPSRKFRIRISRLKHKDFERLLSEEAVCAQIIAVYKMRKGIFCDCPPRELGDLPKTQRVKLKSMH